MGTKAVYVVRGSEDGNMAVFTSASKAVAYACTTYMQENVPPESISYCADNGQQDREVSPASRSEASKVLRGYSFATVLVQYSYSTTVTVESFDVSS